MDKRFNAKQGYEKVVPGILPEIEVRGPVIIVQCRSISHQSGGGEINTQFQDKTYYCDINGILYPKEYLDIYYEEVE